MFRGVVLLLVLLGTADPVAKTLCPSWCDRRPASGAVVCQHAMPSATSISTTNDDSCDMGVWTVYSVPEETRRLVSNVERHHAVVIAYIHFAGSTMSFRSGRAESPPSVSSAHVRSTVLRI